MSAISVDVRSVTKRIIAMAQEREAQISYGCAWKAATAIAYLKRNRLEGFLENLQTLSADARFHAREFCNILWKTKGIDPTPYLKELDRLNALDGLKAVWRYRTTSGTRSSHDMSSLFSERAYRESFGC
jgi:hypothetical protein